MIGRPGRVANTRALVAHPNYVLTYDIAGDLIRILRLLHPARQWPPKDDERWSRCSVAPPEPQRMSRAVVCRQPSRHLGCFAPSQ
jgi:hypothetical protein